MFESSFGNRAGARTGPRTYDEESEAFYLVYRIRRPRGIEPDRGGEIRIARSDDGISFEDIWSGTKAELDSTSIERSALARLPNGNWGLYVSYVDPEDGRWRIDLVETNDLAQCDLASATHVLTAGDIRVEGVKDPFVYQVAGLYHMVVSYATARTRCRCRPDAWDSRRLQHGTDQFAHRLGHQPGWPEMDVGR